MKPIFNKKLNAKADELAMAMVEIFDRNHEPSHQMLHVVDADDCKVIINAFVADKTVYPDL